MLLSIILLLELIGDLFLVGVFNVVQGFGKEVGEVLVISKCIVKLVFIGFMLVGWYIFVCVVENIIFCIVELGGKLFNIYFVDVMDGEEEFIEKVVEGLVFGFFNQGEVCICLLWVLIYEFIYEFFMVWVMEKVVQICCGDLLDIDIMIGVQVFCQQFDKIFFYIQIVWEEGG